MLTENISTLKIHKLTKEQYERERLAGRIDETALYLTPDNEGGGGNADTVDGKHASEFMTNHGDLLRPTYNNTELARMADLNRDNPVSMANTNYTKLMARGTSLNSAETTPAVNGAIAWTYK